jgi:hypothetical protein
MKTSSKRILSIFGSIIGLFFAMAVLMNNVIPGYEQMLRLRAEIAGKEAARNHLETLVSRAREYLARRDELGLQVRPIEAALPTSPNIPELIATLNVLAENNQASMSRIAFELEPHRPQPVGAGAAPDPGVSRVIMRANIVALYPNLEAWLRNVESELRLMDIHVFNLRSIPGEQRPGAGALMSADVVLTAYWQQ